jgi:glycosyltransferase 2 family protein
MKSRIGHGLSILFGLAISAGLLYLALRDVRMSEIALILPQIRLKWVPFLLLIPLLDLWVRALRWKLLLGPLTQTSPKKLFQLEAIGLAINNILFLRVGELARAYVAGKELSLSTTSVLGTILVERLCDTVALLTLFSISAFYVPGIIPSQVRFSVIALAGGLFLALVLLAMLDRHIQLGKPWLRALKAYPRVHLLAEELLVGGRALRGAWDASRIAFLSLMLWLSDSLLFWFTARTLGFDPSLGFFQSVTVVAFAAGASSLPAMPGAFGNFEAFVKYILRRFGYEPGLAIGYAALVHLTMYIIVTGLGLICLYRLGHTFSGLRKALERK